eukprot:s2416_g5.t1
MRSMSSEALAWVRLCQTSDFEVGESNQRAACHHLIPGDRQEEQEAHQNPPLWNPPRRNQGFRALWRVEVVLESAKVLKTIKEVCGSLLVEVLELTAEDGFESGVPAGERHWRLLLASATAVLDDRQAYAAYQAVRNSEEPEANSQLLSNVSLYRHIDTLSVINVPEMESFIGYWQGVLLENAMQRAGFMYGYYLEDKNYDEGTRAIMEAIYEPQQEMAGEVAEMVKDDQEMSRVNRIAEALGLECIGWVFTSLPLEDGLLLSPEEVVRIARLQNDHSTDKHFTKYTLSKFVSCAVRPDPAHNGAPGINPFMVSEQACSMLRDGILTATPSERRACVVREAGKDEMIPDFVCEGLVLHFVLQGSRLPFDV